MAILFRTTSDFTVGGMAARLTVYSGENGRIRVEIAPYPAAEATVYTGSLNVTVTYNGEAKILSAKPFSRPVSAIFTHLSWKKSILLSSSAGIAYHGKTSTSCTVSWKGDGSIPIPELTVSYSSGLRLGASSRIEWTVTGVPEGYRAYTLGVWYSFAPTTQIEPVYTRSCAVGQKTASFEFEHTIPELAEDNIVFYRIAVGLYPEEEAGTAGRDDYVLYLETDSPAYVCTDETVYRIAPCGLRCGGLRKNREMNITWDVVSTAAETKGFRLQYTCDNINWITLLWDVCASKSYLFAVPEGVTDLVFRIQAYSTRSKYEQSRFIYTPWIKIGRSNVYVGYNGNAVPAAEVHIGSETADAVLTVGGRE